MLWRVPGWEWGRTVVNRVVRDVFTEVVTLEYRPERGEGASRLYLGEGGGGGGKSPNRGNSKSKNPMLGMPAW